jgi:hypothetical protein
MQASAAAAACPPPVGAQEYVHATRSYCYPTLLYVHSGCSGCDASTVMYSVGITELQYAHQVQHACPTVFVMLETPRLPHHLSSWAETSRVAVASANPCRCLTNTACTVAE